jgi:hypothetical protein
MTNQINFHIFMAAAKTLSSIYTNIDLKNINTKNNFELGIIIQNRLRFPSPFLLLWKDLIG